MTLTLFWYTTVCQMEKKGTSQETRSTCSQHTGQGHRWFMKTSFSKKTTKDKDSRTKLKRVSVQGEVLRSKQNTSSSIVSQWHHTHTHTHKNFLKKEEKCHISNTVACRLSYQLMENEQSLTSRHQNFLSVEIKWFKIKQWNPSFGTILRIQQKRP